MSANKAEACPLLLLFCSYFTQTHHNSVHSIQINEVLGKLWCVHLLHLTTFTTSLYTPTPTFVTSSFANAVLTPYMGVVHSYVICPLASFFCELCYIRYRSIHGHTMFKLSLYFYSQFKPTWCAHGLQKCKQDLFFAVSSGLADN